jgi:hypothetical protein
MTMTGEVKEKEMFREPTCYLSSKLEGRLRSDGSYGVFARQPVKSGERLTVWGGEIVSLADLTLVPPQLRPYSLQVEEDLYLVTSREGPGDWVNHSCNPNAGLQGQIVLVALRDINVGEEVCYDYAMSDGSPYDEFVCGCGAANCRGQVSGNDWRNPLLQQKYAGYFSPYLQRRIKQLHQITAAKPAKSRARSKNQAVANP